MTEFLWIYKTFFLEDVNNQHTQTCCCPSFLHTSYGKDAESFFNTFQFYAEVILLEAVSKVYSNDVLSELTLSNDKEHIL
jgi:hypothetical protein